MLLSLLAAVAVANAPKSAPQYDVFLGMPQQMAEGVKATTSAMGWNDPKVADSTRIGPDTLVMWEWNLKGNHGIGLQIYGSDGKFKTRLEDSNFPSARAVVCQNRYVVGGGNTLRVWDAAQGYKLVHKRKIANLSQFATKSCQGHLLVIKDGSAVMRLQVPSLTLVR